MKILQFFVLTIIFASGSLHPANGHFSSLKLSNKRLQIIPATEIKRHAATLKVLDLSHNDLRHVIGIMGGRDYGNFPDLPHLEVLVLSHCNLDCIRTGVITSEKMPALRKVVLTGNPMLNGNDFANLPEGVVIVHEKIQPDDKVDTVNDTTHQRDDHDWD